MTIKLVPLTKAFPDAGYGTNRSRAPALAQAAIEYFRAWHLVVAGRDITGLCFHVELPLMHATLELLIKALAAQCDAKFDGLKYWHATPQIVSDYEDRVPAFAVLLSEPGSKELLESLAGAWTAVRYAESFIAYEASDSEMFERIVLRLADAYHAASGLPLLRHHTG